MFVTILEMFGVMVIKQLISNIKLVVHPVPLSHISILPCSWSLVVADFTSPVMLSQPYIHF